MVKFNSSNSRIALCAAALAALAPVSMRGANLSIDDTSPNDTVTISTIDFEGGFSVNGNKIQTPGLGIPGTVSVPETVQIAFTGQWIDQGAAGTGSRTLYLVEAADPTLLSDIFSYSWFPNAASGYETIQGTFVSDLENNLGNLPVGVDPADVYVENGQAVNFSLPFLTGQVLSDVEIPEPNSLPLACLGGGLLLLLSLHRRVALAH